MAWGDSWDEYHGHRPTCGFSGGWYRVTPGMNTMAIGRLVVALWMVWACSWGNPWDGYQSYRVMYGMLYANLGGWYGITSGCLEEGTGQLLGWMPILLCRLGVDV